jgi:hypothetical protein
MNSNRPSRPNTSNVIALLFRLDCSIKPVIPAMLRFVAVGFRSSREVMGETLDEAQPNL